MLLKLNVARPDIRMADNLLAKLAAIRIVHGYTQEQLGKLMNCDQQSISKLERSRDCHLGRLLRFLAHCNAQLEGIGPLHTNPVAAHEQVLKKLTHLRRREGLSQYAVARTTGLSQAYVSALESGYRRTPMLDPRMSTLIGYLGCLGIKLAITSNPNTDFLLVKKIPLS